MMGARKCTHNILLTIFITYKRLTSIISIVICVVQVDVIDGEPILQTRKW